MSASFWLRAGERRWLSSAPTRSFLRPLPSSLSLRLAAEADHHHESDDSSTTNNQNNNNERIFSDFPVERSMFDVEKWKRENGFSGNQGPPPNPFAQRNNRPNKGDLYSSEELQNIWNLHNQLSSTSADGIKSTNDVTTSKSNTGGATASFPALHELVLQTLNDGMTNGSSMKNEKKTDENGSPSQSISPSFVITTQQQQPGSTKNGILPQRLSQIRAIASDVDGTLLTSQHALHPVTQDAIVRAVQATQKPDSPLQHFFLATGKTRTGALANLGTADVQKVFANLPGVFIQGLYCVDGKGGVVFEQKLNDASVQATVEMAMQYNLTLFGYHADALYTLPFCNPQHVRDVHEKYGEPKPIVLNSITDHEFGWHKLLLMHDDDHELKTVYRPMLDALADQHNASTTQAVKHMIELLPAGCSKALGVQKLCEKLGIDPYTELLAIGDGENDMGMLQMAACGVAVGNAVPTLKEIADIVMEESNNEGGAGIAIERLILSRGAEER